MQICRIDPITDSRWKTFVESHPQGRIFHTPAWLEALRRTYGYEPVAYVSIGSGGQFVSGIPFCKIRSLLTGRRLASLPFSDHCQPLTTTPEELRSLLQAAEDEARDTRCKYVEIRPLEAQEEETTLGPEFGRSKHVFVHRLDLARDEADVVEGFHKNCIRRKITRSGRELLRYEEGRSEELLVKFYRLMILTRRRHQLPPQPLVWYRNLIDCLGEQLKIRIASKDDTPVAGIITLSFKNVVVDKYNASDPEFNALGGMVMLLWRTIQEAMAQGVTELDLGRSDDDNPGLVAFKDHWGAVRSSVNYYRFPRPAVAAASTPANSFATEAAKRLLGIVPDSMLTTLGGVLYRHVG